MKPRYTISREKCICATQAMNTEKMCFIDSRLTRIGESFVKLNNQESGWLKEVLRRRES